MSKGRMAYFEDEDVLHFAISEDPEAGSVEISPEITAEVNAKGELIGIEILHASRFLRDTVLDSVQARMLEGGYPLGASAGTWAVEFPPRRTRRARRVRERSV